MKNIAQIMDRINGREMKERDVFGFGREALLTFVPWEQGVATGIIKSETAQKDWETATEPLTEEAVRARILDYLEFAWTKIEGHRGLSAGRSVHKLREWFWILEDEEAVNILEDESLYPPYGAPAVARVSERIGAPIPSSDKIQRMILGQSCEPECEGCNR